MTPAAVPLSVLPNTELAAPSTPRDNAPVATSPSSTQTTSTDGGPGPVRDDPPDQPGDQPDEPPIPRATMIRATVSAAVTTTTRM